MNIRRQDRLAARTVRFIYTVSGETAFPIDMLRYDGSYPASSTDASAIIESFIPGNHTRRVINLMTTRDKNWLPIQARWRSFGWRVE